jgi:hypothetical protein
VSELVRIAMWSGPRNISTAMMRSFGSRPDTVVVDEPFYAAYLAATGLQHPMRAEVLASQPQDWREVAQALLGDVPASHEIYYQKHMTHHMLPDFGRDWMVACRNAFLIRSPREVLISYRARHDTVRLDDIGVVQQAALFDWVCDRLGHAPPVIDAADMLRDPGAALMALCGALGISFSPCMLHWAAGTRATDGVWAPAWYHAVESSTGFSPIAAEPMQLDDALRPVAEAAWPIYERLAAHRIVVADAAVIPF